tara:strand:+ start:116 stop:346 length:231 start_codon:yes stop_codon:yes gene_type:complete
MSYRLSDEIISQIAKLVQLAILTGTDVVDNLRMISVTESESDSNILILTDEYRGIAEDQIQTLLEVLQEQQNTVEE